MVTAYRDDRISQAGRLFVLLAALVPPYLLQRGACALGIPDDCIRELDGLEVFRDLNGALAFLAGVAWVTRAWEPQRVAWLTSPSRWYLWLTLTGTPIVYSLISDFPELKHDFSDVSSWGWRYTLIITTASATALVCLALHLARAAWPPGPAAGPGARAARSAARLSGPAPLGSPTARHPLRDSTGASPRAPPSGTPRPPADLEAPPPTGSSDVPPGDPAGLGLPLLPSPSHASPPHPPPTPPSLPPIAVYLLLRLIPLGYLAGSMALLSATSAAHIHLHHLYIGLALASWAEFDTWWSGSLLAVGSGIFIQGVASYSLAPVALPNACFETPSSPGFDCAFRATDPFVLRICSAHGPMPSHACGPPV